MYEVFTIGGGRFLFNFFGAVAAITQSIEFQFAVVFALLVSFIWMLFVIAFKMNDLKPLVIWLFSSVLIMAGLLGPTFTVQITDRIDRIQSTAFRVDNVPAGLAIFASLTSTAGDLITQQFETNFNDVNVPSMRDHGFLFGVELMAKASRMEINDSLFAQSMSSFIENCLFYDILLGTKSFDDLEEAADTWTYITSNPAKSRFFELRYKDGNGWDSEIVSCEAGIGKTTTGLTERWNNILTDAQDSLVRKVVPGVARDPNITHHPTAAVLRSTIVTELSQMHLFLIGSAKNATDMLQDTMTLNAILDEPVNWLSRTNNSAGLTSYINARLDLQTEQSYRAIGRQAKKWVPNLKAVFQCIYYGIFPLAVLMMLSPIGASVVKNYIFGLVWIESWGPLFAIISYIVNSEASDRMQAVVQSVDSSVEDITIASISGIGVVESDISVMAGYLSMSVPFIAIALASGARSFAVLATSTLAVSQEAVGATTTESATGNLSLGNTSFRNDSFFNTSGNTFDTSASHNSGILSYVDSGTGTTYTEAGGPFGDPNRTYINTQEGSFGTNVSGANQVSSALTKAGERVESYAKGFDTRITDGKSAFHGEVSDWSKSLVDGTFISSVTGVENRDAIARDYATTLNLAERLGASNNVSTKEALDAIGAFNLSTEKFGGGPDGKFAYSQIASNDISFEEVENLLKDTSDRTAVSNTVSASTTDSGGTRGEESTSLSDRVDSGFRETVDLTKAQHVAYNDAETFKVAAQNVRDESNRVDSNFNDAFFTWLNKDENSDLIQSLGYNSGTHLADSRDLKSVQIKDELANQFVKEELLGNADYLSQFGVGEDLHAKYLAGSAGLEGDAPTPETFDRSGLGVNAGNSDDLIHEPLAALKREGYVVQTDVGQVLTDDGSQLQVDAANLEKNINEGQETPMINRQFSTFFTNVGESVEYVVDGIGKGVGVVKSGVDAVKDAQDASVNSHSNSGGKFPDDPSA